jgi:hypothetical protein
MIKKAIFPHVLEHSTDDVSIVAMDADPYLNIVYLAERSGSTKKYITYLDNRGVVKWMVEAACSDITML